jgi:hypothetical protein
MMTATDADQTYQQAVAARELAARKLYEAEVAVHDAHQTHVDGWIRAAHDRLHTAVTRYLAAGPPCRPCGPPRSPPSLRSRS